jgi:hypothetical protein
VHAGHVPDAATGARAVPIYQSTSFVFEDTTDAASLFALQKYGLIYSRIANPTVVRAGGAPGQPRGRDRGGATASGQAAEFLTFACLAGAGDEIVAAAGLYGGTVTQLDVTLRRFGVSTTFVPTRPARRRSPRRSPTGTKLVFAEVVANPSGEVADIAALADVAHAAGCRWSSTPRWHPLPVPADRARRRRRHPLGHEVPRRARHDARRGGRRVRPVRLGQRALPADDRADPVLRRAELVGQLRRVGSSPSCAREQSARHRPGSPRTARSCCCRAWRRCRSGWTRTWPTRRRVAEWLHADDRVS